MRLYALFFALVTTAAAARASEGTTAREQPPRFVVVPLHEVERSRVEALYTALAAAGAEVVDETARAGVDLPLAPALFRDATLDEPRAALLAARAALHELALDDVDARLDEALASALRLPNPADHRDLLADILLLRAELALARAVPDEALADLRLLARVDERREELHPGLFPPNLVAAYVEARAENERAAPAYLTVSDDAGEASLVLVVDGREVPAEDARAGLDVKAGPHLVTLRGDGRVSRSFVVDIASSDPFSVDARLFAPGADEARAEALAALRAAPHDDEAIARLLESSGASAALVLAADGVYAFSPARGRVPLVEDDDPLALARTTLAAVSPPVPVAAVTPRPPVEAAARPAEETSAVPLVLGTGAVLVVVAAVAAGAGALAWALQPAEPVAPVPAPIAITCCGQGR